MRGVDALERIKLTQARAAAMPGLQMWRRRRLGAAPRRGGSTLRVGAAR